MSKDIHQKLNQILAAQTLTLSALIEIQEQLNNRILSKRDPTGSAPEKPANSSHQVRN